MNKKDFSNITIIFFIGLLFRIFLMVYIAFTNPHDWDFFNNPNWQGADQGDFAKLVINIVDHKSFSFSDSAPYLVDQYRTPLFPYFMALSYWLTRGFFLFSVLNILVSSCIGIIAYFIAKKIFVSAEAECEGGCKNDKISFWSALIFSLLPYGAYLSTMAMADNLFAFFFVLSIFFAVKFLKEQAKIGDLVLAGIFLSCATLVRPISQYFIIFIALAIFFIKAVNWNKKILWSAAVIIGFLFTSGPWLARNYVLFNNFAFSSLGGYHMFVSWWGPYKAYFVDKVSRGEEHRLLYEYIQQKYGVYGPQAMYHPAISEALGAEAKNAILKVPFSYAAFHAASSFIYFFNNDIILTLSEVFKVNSGNVYVFDKLVHLNWRGLFSSLLRLNWLYLAVYVASYLFIVVKTFLAFFGAGKHFRVSPAIAFLVFSIFVYFPLIIGPEGHARFRYPMEPFLLMFAMAMVIKIRNPKQNCHPEFVSGSNINSKSKSQNSKLQSKI